jgi:hypothetical protein
MGAANIMLFAVSGKLLPGTEPRMAGYRPSTVTNGNNNDILSNTDFQKAWSCIFTSPFVSIVWHLFSV